MPEAGQNGVLVYNQEEHRTREGWAKILGFRPEKLKAQLHGKKGITAKDSMKNIREDGFFAESVIQQVFGISFAKNGK